MLVQFAQMAVGVLPRRASASADPLVGLLSIGEEPTKGTPLVKETHALLAGRRERASRSTATSRAATSSARPST